jgi:hypothetical protein
MSKFFLTNAVFFQLVWFACAIYQQSSIVIVSLLIVIHFILSPSPLNDFKVLVLSLVGISVDQALFVAGVIEFSSSSPVIPYWLILLWCYFAMCFNHSLRWTLSIPVWGQSILGGVFGTLSYLAAVNFEAIASPFSTVTFVICFFVVWAALFPLLIITHKRLIPLTHYPKKVPSC